MAAITSDGVLSVVRIIRRVCGCVRLISLSSSMSSLPDVLWLVMIKAKTFDRVLSRAAWLSGTWWIAQTLDLRMLERSVLISASASTTRASLTGNGRNSDFVEFIWPLYIVPRAYSHHAGDHERMQLLFLLASRFYAKEFRPTGDLFGCR